MTGRDPLALVVASLEDFDFRLEPLNVAAESLRVVAESAGQASQHDVAQCANLLARILEILVWSGEGQQCTSFDGAKEIAAFISSATFTLRSALDDEPGSVQQIEETISDARARWGEWIDLLDDGVGPASAAECPADVDEQSVSDEDTDEEQLDATSAEELGRILAAVSHCAKPPETGEDAAGKSPGGLDIEQSVVAETDSGLQPLLHPPPVQTIEMEPDLLEAYLDDAVRCLASLEAATLSLEQDPHDRRSLQQLCRELHTMKGASASVGLNDLASYLHAVEESVQTACDSQDVSVDVEQVLTSVDTIRDHITKLGLNHPPDGTNDIASAPEPRGQPAFEEGGRDTEETIRIKASQLDRLMDMLAELVMLRNRRESRVAELQTFNDDLMQCSSRLRIEADNIERTMDARQRPPLSELASDLLETTRNQREICERISEENIAVSGFIRNFRQELTELQRLPVAGLFLRLQRAVRDAAHREGKKVQLQMLGEHAGLKRTLQERLYEPLLHIVRNAVSHGIESESLRIAAGKDPIGTIVLEALGGSNLLVLEIRDDGKGLDYDALRRRGVEQGLIAPQQPTSREELAQLIFHPGFSTKAKSSAVSGRGIGMDVVAESLSRMRSWVDVESVPNQGTRIRLSIPLRSVIEHTMVFRAAGQLLAVPMQFVHCAGEARPAASAPHDTGKMGDFQATDLPAIHISELIADGQPALDSGQRLVLGYSRRVLADNQADAAPDTTFSGRGRRFELLVDEIVGPEEVVIRPLPSLLRHQDLFSGITLSGRGKVVLLFDSRRLIDLGLRRARPPQCRPAQPCIDSTGTISSMRVLVADDSISARRCLVRLLRQHGLEVTEVSDGVEAIEQLRSHQFAAVFSDLEMPRVGGLEVLREIATTQETNRVPVVIVSSRDDEIIQTEARELGASAYLIKPAVESQIAAVVK
ncbi:MAG: response regulator [Pirellulaceae bacterium]|nr:response regulator [Pirellulaceae bacterium]